MTKTMKKIHVSLHFIFSCGIILWWVVNNRIFSITLQHPISLNINMHCNLNWNTFKIIYSSKECNALLDPSQSTYKNQNFKLFTSNSYLQHKSLCICLLRMATVKDGYMRLHREMVHCMIVAPLSVQLRNCNKIN